MLRRINAGLFEEDEDADIELAVQSQGNNGTQSAQFDYDQNVLNQDTVQGFPGCRIRVRSGIRQFRALVVFDPAAPPTARYDLFQVNAAGTLTAVGKSVANTGGTSLIGFGIDGVAVAVPVGVAPPRGIAPGRRKAAKRPKRAAGKAKATRKKKAKAAKRPAKARRKPAPKRGKTSSRKKAKR